MKLLLAHCILAIAMAAEAANASSLVRRGVGFSRILRTPEGSIGSSPPSSPLSIGSLPLSSHPSIGSSPPSSPPSWHSSRSVSPTHYDHVSPVRYDEPTEILGQSARREAATSSSLPMADERHAIIHKQHVEVDPTLPQDQDMYKVHKYYQLDQLLGHHSDPSVGFITNKVVGPNRVSRDGLLEPVHVDAHGNVHSLREVQLREGFEFQPGQNPNHIDTRPTVQLKSMMAQPRRS